MMRTLRMASAVTTVLMMVVAVTAAGGAPAVGSLTASPPATSVLAGHTVSGAPIPCATQPNGVRFCHGASTGGGSDLRIASFDGTPIDAYVTLPAAPGTGMDGDYPLIVQNHGWGAPPSGPNDAQYGGPTAAQWAAKGYVVLQLTARGWGDSCGTAASRAVAPAACAHGYIRLDDVRYEVRDIQFIVGLLVDEGLADPNRIGAIGESYGGGATLELATLDDRTMLPDGSLTPWRSPGGIALHIAAAAPLYSWSDMAMALAPNGRTFVDQVTPPADDLAPIGVWKQSIDSGLHLVGQLFGYYAPAGSGPDADIDAWFAALSVGNPSATPALPDVVGQVTRYHSAYHLLAGTYGVPAQQPPPLFFVQGFTDEVFPVDEVMRYVNLEKSRYPDAPVSMYFLDGGHQRAQNKAADGALVGAQIEAFFNSRLDGIGSAPADGVTALTQTCGAGTPSGGPFQASTFAGLAPGSVTFTSAPAETVSSSTGDAAVAKSLDPVTGGLACTTVPGTDQGPGVATYRLPAARGDGFTLLGAPEISAQVTTTGSNAFLAARLFDIDPTTNTAVLVTRGVYRIDPNHPAGTVTFPLAANGWHFAAGHIPKLELLGNDAPYLGASPVPFTVTVSNLTLNLPTHEPTPSAPTTPQGATPATPLAAQPTFTG